MSKATLLGLCLIALVILLIHRGQSQWHRESVSLVDRVKARAEQPRQPVDLQTIHNLPPPVKRYFMLVLKQGSAIIQTTSLTQLGGFRAKPDQDGWSSMQAKQVFASNPPAFVWDARISVLPGVDIQVRDTYLTGSAVMQAKLMSMIPMIEAHDHQALNTAALQRYLAEAVWFPTALLPSQGVSWRELAPYRARASISDAGLAVYLDFEFNARGEVVSVYSPARNREVSGSYEPTPWKGYFSDYRTIDGYLIPTAAKVEWYLADRTYPYWHARLHEVEYTFD
ncbi:MAG: hypothetical protein QNJ78_14535 [Gammaproteobacteria bacterium]|nr:hypothetical protein [Gammaproteobacteria bacterium]